MAETNRQRYQALLTALKTERSSFESHWKEIGDFLFPRGVRTSTSDTNRGTKRYDRIVDGSGVMAARTLAAGMTSGMTSPARPWFRLGTIETELAKFGPVKDWLETCRATIASILLRSNFYKQVPILYRSAGVFGTGAMGCFEDERTLVRFQGYPLREYFLALDYREDCRVFVREFRMTVRQIVGQFGKFDRAGNLQKDNLSATVANAWDRSNYDTAIDVCHVITANTQANPRSLGAKFKPFTDCYFESGNSSDGNTDRYLREAGFDEFPIFAFRWETQPGDVYGTDCPGMTALGDVKQLQTAEKISLSAIDKMVRPPMVAPSSARAARLSQLPGDLSYFDETKEAAIRPLVDTTTFRVDLLESKQEQVRARIDEAFYKRLFLMLSTIDPKDVTATAVNEMKEEKLLMLGPVLGQADQDVLKPNIDRVFAIALRNGMLPPPPPELEGQELEVEYVSALAQALKAIGRSGVDAFTGYALQLAQVQPDVMDKLDTDVMIERYAEMTGVPPDMVHSDDEAAELRRQRADMQRGQAAMASATQGAAAAKDLADAKITDDSALSAVLNAGGGVPANA